jgi:radical SAM superfamily enzyme YgiQ (UPF0313 family)
MKVLLVSANTLTEPYPVYPLGLDYVAGALAPEHQVQIADMNSLGGCDALGEMIRQFSPAVIGLSLRNIDNTDTTDPKGFFGQYRQIAKAIRKHSNALLVLGGSGFTIFPVEAMQALEADYGIIGEGERLARLLRSVEKGENPAEISGVVTCSNPTAFPAPWEGKIGRHFHADRSYLPFYLKNGGMLNLQTQRGCRFNCIYCTYPHIEGHRLRLADPDEAAATAIGLQKAGAKYLFVTDSVLNADCEHSLAVAEAFKKAGVSIPWCAFFAPLPMPDNYFKIMAAAGLTHVEFGTESLSDRVLTSYRKPFRVKNVLQAHRAANDAGLYVAHYLLLGGPGETSATFDETLANAARLQRCVLFFFCGMRIYPHTALYDMAVAEGQLSKNRNILEPVFYRSPAIDTREMVRQVEQQAKQRQNWVVGAGGEETAAIIARLYERGHSGPLWEYLIR